MPETPQTVEDLGRLVKEKYPGAYDEKEDADLGRRFKAKYAPAYDDFADVRPFVGPPVSARGEMPATPPAKPSPYDATLAGKMALPQPEQAEQMAQNAATPLAGWAIQGGIAPPAAGQPPQVPMEYAPQLFGPTTTFGAPPTPGGLQEGFQQHLAQGTKPFADFTGVASQFIHPEQYVEPRTQALATALKGGVQGLEDFGTAMMDPTNAVTLVATMGVGSVPVVTTLMHAGFTFSMLHSLWEQFPQLKKQIQAGDLQGTIRTLTNMGLTGKMAYETGKGTAESFKAEPAVKKIQEIRKRQAATREAEAKGTSTTGVRPGERVTPKSVTTPVKATAPLFPKKPARAPEAQTGAAPAQPAQKAAETPAAQPQKAAETPKPRKQELTDEALVEMLKTEPPGLKRRGLETVARYKGIPIPEIKSRAEQAGEALSNLAHYHDLFDQADARMKEIEAAEAEKERRAAKGAKTRATPRATTPVHGPSEQVQRVVAAREDIAKRLEVRWEDLNDTERKAIDALISEGQGHSVVPLAETKTPAKETKENAETTKPSTLPAGNEQRGPAGPGEPGQPDVEPEQRVGSAARTGGAAENVGAAPAAPAAGAAEPEVSGAAEPEGPEEVKAPEAPPAPTPSPTPATPAQKVAEKKAAAAEHQRQVKLGVHRSVLADLEKAAANPDVKPAAKKTLDAKIAERKAKIAALEGAQTGKGEGPSAGRTIDVPGTRATERQTPPSGGSEKPPVGGYPVVPESPQSAPQGEGHPPSGGDSTSSVQTQRGEPGWVGNVPTGELHVDPSRFQFKQNVGQGGAGEEFREVQKWDPEKAGVISVWRDPKDGRDYVVNGHHRYEMATRLGAPEMTVRYLDAPDAPQARLKGALINIAEGRGEATDAAKVFRESGMTPGELEREGVSLRGKIANEGLGVSKLAQPIYNDVMNGDLSTARGAVIGHGLSSDADQLALYDAVKQREARGKRITNAQLEEMIRLAKGTPRTAETSEQQSMFGEQEMERSLLPEKAEISEYVRKQLAGEKKLFGLVGESAAAAKLGKAGNVIQQEKNLEIAEQAGRVQALYDRLSSFAGPVDDALNQAAKRLADGENANDVKREAYDRIRDSLIEQSNRYAGVRPGVHPGTEGHDSEGPHQVEAVRPRSEPPVEPAKPAEEVSEKAPPLAASGDVGAEREAIRRDEEKARAQWNTGPAANLPSGDALEDSPLFGGPRQGSMFGDEGAPPSDAPRVGLVVPKGGAPTGPFADARARIGRWLQGLRDQYRKTNLSGRGAVKSKLVRNLSQLEKAGPRAWEAAVRAAGSKGQAAVMMRGAVPRIMADLKGSGLNWDIFRTALVESRLRGARARWRELADTARRASDADLRRDFPHYASLLENVEGRRGIAEDAKQKAESLFEKADAPLVNPNAMDELRNYIADRLDEAANRVGTVMPPRADFGQITAKPQFQKALQTYKQTVESPMAESHALNEGVFSDALGPLDTYYPLIPLDEGKPSFQTGRSTPYRKPRNISNAFATGLGDQYDLGTAALLDRLSTALRMNNRAGLIQALFDEGLARPLGKQERGGETISVGGRDFNARVVETGRDRQIVRDGKVSYVPATRALIPEWLADELEPILEKKKPPTAGVVRRVLDKVNSFALAGPTDAVFHASNILGSMVANTPYLGDGFAAKTIGNTPVTKLFTAAVKLATTDATSPEALKDLTEMARKGMLGDRYARETYSKRIAEQTGAEVKRFGLGPLLNGPNGLDVRARLVMYRLAKEINPNASTAEQLHFVNQLGSYVYDLQGTIERRAKSSGFAPFYTAGSTMLRNGINAWTGQGPMPEAGAGLRIAQQLSGGAAGVVGMWAITYRAATGKWPWEDDKAKFLEIPVPDSVRRSDFGKSMWGSDFSKDGYVRFAFFDPIVERGARAMGIEGGANALMRGASAGQAMEYGLKDTMNTAAEPFTTGPGTKASFILATGKEPGIASLRDRTTGEFGPQFFPATAVAPPGLPSLASRAFEAALNTNSFFQNAAAAAGIAHSSGQQAESKADAALRMVADLAFPRLLSTGYNAGQHVQALARERGAIERAQDAGERRKLRQSMTQALRGGNAMPKEVTDAIRTGKLHTADINQARRESRETPFQAGFARLPFRDALDSFEAASAAEKRTVRAMLKAKADRALRAQMPPAERLALIKEYREAMAAQ